MPEFFDEGGWSMYPTMLFGVLAVSAVGMPSPRPSPPAGRGGKVSALPVTEPGAPLRFRPPARIAWLLQPLNFSLQLEPAVEAHVFQLA